MSGVDFLLKLSLLYIFGSKHINSESDIPESDSLVYERRTAGCAHKLFPYVAFVFKLQLLDHAKELKSIDIW